MADTPVSSSRSAPSRSAPQPGAPQPGAPQPGAPQPGGSQPGGSPRRLAGRAAAGAVAAAVLLAVLAGCDSVPGPTSLEQRPPEVTNLSLAPDRVDVAALPDEQVQDSIARVPVAVTVEAADPDGRVARVFFTLEPSRLRGAAIRVPLDSIAPRTYGVNVSIGLPARTDEVYTVRGYAVDDDSLISNQVQGQLRVVAE